MTRAARVSTLAAAVSSSLAALGALAACDPHAAPPEVPPPTSARPAGSTPVLSGPVTSPRPSRPDAAGHPHDHALHGHMTPGPARVALSPGASFVKSGDTVEVGVCVRVVIAARGTLAAHVRDGASGVPPRHAELGPGDTLVVTNAASITLQGEGTALAVRQDVAVCAVDDMPPREVQLVKATAARELRWARGAMTAHHDVRTPELYVGRLAGTAPVAEHEHATSIEVLAAFEGAGTFTLGGKEQRLVAPQIVVVPAGVRHAWKPDPGTTLVAVQTYAPPGPEERFLALDAAERDAGAGQR